MKVNFSVSNLYVIMKMNYFKKFDKVLLDVWKSYDYKGFQEFEKKIKALSKKELIPSTLSNTKQIKELEQKYKLDISNLVTSSQSKKNAVEMKKEQQTIIDKISTTVKGKDKERLINLVKTETNTKYGTFQEDSAIKLFETTTHKKVKQQQKRFEYYINTLNDVEWYLIGKLDGVIDDGNILEIKNRVNKLFNEVRRYEEPQIMTYMKMAGSDKGYMLEQYKNKTNPDFNINMIEYKYLYFENQVLPALYSFQKFFNHFITNDELKEQLICGQEAELYKLYSTY